MIELSEEYRGRKSIYTRMIVDEDGVVVSMETVDFRAVHVQKDNKDYFVIYDQNMIPIRDAFRYLNFSMQHLSYNSREQAMHALKLLYSYLALTKTDIHHLGRKDVNNLIHFLLGYSPSMGSVSMKLLTTRRNATVNDYLSTYRNYFKDAGIECDYLTKDRAATSIFKEVNGKRTTAQTIRTYESSLRESTPIQTVPKYISVEEFERIIAIVREDNSLQAEILVRLMYQFGFRLGECLGLTNEDITERKVNGRMYPVAILRNRMSDNKKFQSAKLKMHTESEDGYKTENYNSEKLGYDKVYLTYDFYELINDYIEDRLTIAAKNKRLDRSIADKVVSDKHAPDNHYIFLNTLDAPLSAKEWNKYLKTVYLRAGIDIDKNTKKNNLNHRLRHGFAMFQVKYRHVDAFTLMKLMRHSSITSTNVYFNPTEDDEFEMKTEFVESLYELIPSLKENPTLHE